MSNRTNEVWLRDLAEGAPDREAAIAALRQRLQRGLFYYLSRERSDLSNLAPEEITHMAEDFAQEATLRVLSALDTFRGDSQFTTWATKIAVRLAISEMRRVRYKDFSLDALMTTPDGSIAETTLVAAPDSEAPERLTEKQEIWKKVQAALNEALTPRQRAAIEAVVLEDVPLDIVADRLGTNRNALYKLIFDARRKLRQHFEAQGLSPEYVLNVFEES
ncbi:MAG: RNA polymerase sigma factor [Anaerolineae bacterium]